MALICPRYISFFWGMAEATFFFFVPDIWLSYIALQNPKEAYINILYAVCGAIIGGIMMYWAGMFYFDSMLSVMHEIPAISHTLTDHVGSQMTDQSLFFNLVTGMFTGVPYKIYALYAGQMEIFLALFIVSCIVARAARFLVVTSASHGISMVLKRKISPRGVIYIYLGVWIIFYMSYFYVMGI